MTRQPHDKPEALDPLTVAEDVNAFLLSDLGKIYMTALNGKYNEMHHKAELETMSAEQKAFYVERAAGLKIAMNWMISRKQNYDNGAYEKK